MPTKPTCTAERSALHDYLQRTLYGTAELSHLLDTLNSAEAPSHGEVQAVVGASLASGVFEISPRTVELFTQYFGEETGLALLRLLQNEVARSAFMEPGAVLLRLWTSQDPWRLKRCPACPQYFFDDTKNGNKQYCTTRCMSRVTTRLHRRRTRQLPVA